MLGFEWVLVGLLVVLILVLSPFAIKEAVEAVIKDKKHKYVRDYYKQKLEEIEKDRKDKLEKPF